MIGRCIPSLCHYRHRWKSNSVCSSMNEPAVSSWAIQSVCVPFRPTWTRTRRRTRSAHRRRLRRHYRFRLRRRVIVIIVVSLISPTFKPVISLHETRKAGCYKCFSSTNASNSRRPRVLKTSAYLKKLSYSDEEDTVFSIYKIES